MFAHRVKATIQPNGTIVIDNLPFPDGEDVEIIILASESKKKKFDPYSLRGTPVRYDDPTEPVAVDDWEVNQ